MLKPDEHLATLATEEGWRRRAARRRVLAVLAVALLAVASVAAAFNYRGLLSLIPAGGYFAFQAGRLKAEDDRLNRRGVLERLRPPGL